MNCYYVETQKEGLRTFYTVRCRLDGKEVPAANQFLMHKLRESCSPNTVKRFAFSISYYLSYLEEKHLTVGLVFGMAYDRQHAHFIEFLHWLRAGKHILEPRKRGPNNSTCNTYLQDIFGWYQFLELENEQFQNLKVLSSHVVTFTNSIGIRFSVARKTFKGYLPEDEHIGRTIEQDQILMLLLHCTNVRDQLLLLLLAETGFRIGEMLGIRYTRDVDYENRTISVRFRENWNGARAKNAEHRRAKLSEETFEVFQFYLSEYRELLKKTEYLFVIFVSPVGPYFKGGFKTTPYVITRKYDRAAPLGTGTFKVGGNYAASLRASCEAHAAGYSAEFYLDAREKKYMDECGAANFFGIKDNTYITPLSTSILPSITNKSLMQLAEDMGIKVERRQIPEDELTTLEEAGACGTAAVISPIERIDDPENNRSYVISKDGKPGPLSTKLYNRLRGIQLGEEEDVHNWNTIIEL